MAEAPLVCSVEEQFSQLAAVGGALCRRLMAVERLLAELRPPAAMPDAAVSVAASKPPWLNPEELLATGARVDLRRLRTQCVLSYDTSEHRFREAIVRCLGLGGGQDDNADAAGAGAGTGTSTSTDNEIDCEEVLSSLPPAPPSQICQERSNRGGSRGPGTIWIQRWCAAPTPTHTSTPTHTPTAIPTHTHTPPNSRTSTRTRTRTCTCARTHFTPTAPAYPRVWLCSGSHIILRRLLGDIHKHTRRCRGLAHRRGIVYLSHLRLSRPEQSAKEFDAVLLGFLRSVVLPDINDPRGIVYQRQPTFRCHVVSSLLVIWCPLSFAGARWRQRRRRRRRRRTAGGGVTLLAWDSLHTFIVSPEMLHGTFLFRGAQGWRRRANRAGAH